MTSVEQLVIGICLVGMVLLMGGFVVLDRMMIKGRLGRYVRRFRKGEIKLIHAMRGNQEK
jgi:hypothetical protein